MLLDFPYRSFLQVSASCSQGCINPAHQTSPVSSKLRFQDASLKQRLMLDQKQHYRYHLSFSPYKYRIYFKALLDRAEIPLSLPKQIIFSISEIHNQIFKQDFLLGSKESSQGTVNNLFTVLTFSMYPTKLKIEHKFYLLFSKLKCKKGTSIIKIHAYTYNIHLYIVTIKNESYSLLR